MKEKYQSIEYKFRDQRLYEDYCCVYSIGWEYWKNPVPYFWECRAGSEKQCIFQYTVSGEGLLMIDRQSYPMRAGQAFLIERPGPFQYLLPKHSDHWEIKFLSLNFSSMNIWKDITQKFGRIVTLSPDSGVMKCWNELYSLFIKDEIESFFTASSYAYRFMMNLYDTLYKENLWLKNDILQTCLEVIQTNYKGDISLQYLSEICQVSPSYLSKKFKESFQVSPIKYLINHRIEVASSLLLRSRMRIEEIAEEVGFESANYFARAFKQVKGVSPSEFRERECVRKVENQSLRLEIAPDFQKQVSVKE